MGSPTLKSLVHGWSNITRSWRAYLFAVVALSGFVMVASAAAHTYPAERTAVLQLKTSHAELLLIYKEPAGPRTDRLLALYDQNGNGQIDGLETRLARRAFLSRAFAGLTFEFDAQSGEKAPELRFRRDPDGGISVAILQRIDLIIGRDELVVGVKMEAGEGLPPLELIVEPVLHWRLRDGSGRERKLVVQPGQHHEVTLAREALVLPTSRKQERKDQGRGEQGE